MGGVFLYISFSDLNKECSMTQKEFIDKFAKINKAMNVVFPEEADDTMHWLAQILQLLQKAGIKICY